MYDNNEHNPRWAREESRDKREDEEKKGGEEKSEERRGEERMERREELTRQSHSTHTHGGNL